MRFFRLLMIHGIVLLAVNTFAQIEKDTIPTDKREDQKLPTFTLSASDLEGLEESQDISGLLQSSRDIFVSTAGYVFGSARYRIRGYGSENTSVLINGISVNDMGSGRAYWSAWGGLNDALRNQEIKTGISASDLAFGGIGGVTNIYTRASLYSKTTKVSYSLANRSYRNRMMVLASTGMMKNGLAVTFSGSRRWAQEGYVEGTFYDAWSYFLSVEKKINDHHSIGFVGYGAPNKRGRAGVSTQEAYDLAGTNFYNAYWGYQKDEKRNSRIGNYHQPMLMLSHYWTVSEKSKITTTAYYNFGRGGSTALNWVETGDPRPDYYRNLPSYYEERDPAEFDKLTRLWKDDVAQRQIDWDYFYFANSKYMNTINNVDGISGNKVTFMRSKFIVEDRRNDKSEIGLNSVYNNRINDNLTISGGLNIAWYRGHHFKVIDDLLGGEYWLDIDKYSDQEPFELLPISQSDLRNPNRLVKVGDIFGYDYNSNIHKYEGFFQAAFTYNKIDYYVGLDLSNTSFWRTGNMQNGKFPEESYGESKKENFTNYGLKGGAVYKVTGRNFVSVNAAYLTRAPYFRTAYVSARIRDQVIDNLQSENILSGDINYILRAPRLKSRMTLYYTQFNDQTWARSFYVEGLNVFGNYVMTGVNKQSAGIEFGVEANVTPTVTLSGVYGKGQHIYTSRPKVTISQDNDSEVLVKDRTVYLKNYYVGGSPQTIASLGIKYSSPKYWFASFNFNFMDDIYIDINPERRTEEAIANYYEGDVRIDEILDQEKFASAFTVNFFGGKSWKIDDYYVGLTVSVNNILNNTDYRTGGFEQLRFDDESVEKFPSRYFYLYGTTYFINLSIRK